VIDSHGEFMILSREINIDGATYMVNASPVIAPGGETSGAVAVFRDITALKKLETAKSMFVSMVAHEVKSPLAAAEGWLNLILSGMVKHDPEEEKRIIARSLLRVKTLRGMVSELLNLTAIETGNFTLRRAPLDLAAVAAEAAEANREKAAEKKITIDAGGAPKGEPGNVLADHDALLIVANNLVENAIKYTPEGGKVWIRTARSGMYMSLSVEDTGIGMTPEERGKVFDEFFRARNEHTANIPGTGLGLSLVKRLTELHQGKVEVTSEPGKGSTFTVSLPVNQG
jgi:two-component system phosphate regulon sensor histidine kinase PhoR